MNARALGTDPQLVPSHPTSAVTHLLAGFDLMKDPGLSDRDREVIEERARKAWITLLEAAGAVPGVPAGTRFVIGADGSTERPILEAVQDELIRATVKFPTWPTDPLHAVAVLGEEFGELIKAMLQLTYEPHKTCAADVRTEAIQTAAMALRLAMSLKRYEYRRSKQHSQQAGGTAS